MKKDPRVYLAHIMECIEKIEQFTADGQTRFLRDAMVQDAVLRNFGVIGEATGRLGVSLPTIARGRDALAGLGIVSEITGRQRNRVYACDEYHSTLTREPTGS